MNKRIPIFHKRISTIVIAIAWRKFKLDYFDLAAMPRGNFDFFGKIKLVGWLVGVLMAYELLWAIKR